MKLLSKSLLAAGALALSAFAQGATVTQWSANVTGIWSSYAPNAGVTLSNAQKTLSWGTPAFPNTQQSSLAITNPPANQNVNTYIGGGMPPASFTVPTISLTHNNRPIFAPSLTDATLRLTLGLTPIAPPGATQNIPPVNYDIRFLETPNQTPCTVTSPTPCNDIFVLLDGLLNTSFVYDAQTYFINAFPIAGGALTTLSNAACAAVGQGAGCLGFTTPENQSTNLAFGLTVSTEPLAVPEPGSVALIGLALGALALANRRRSVKPEA